MSKRKAVWFMILFILTIVTSTIAILTCQEFEQQLHLPWWGVLLTCLMTAILPIGIITATTNMILKFLSMASMFSGPGKQERHPLLVPTSRKRTSSSAEQYDVFINHRGPDVKATLAWQLYESLQKENIRVFLDDPESKLGESFCAEIRNAISSAAVHIVIFSPQYAQSAWCLFELFLMFETKAIIIPLFYKSALADFRYIRREVKKAFSKLEKERRYPENDIQRCKECVKETTYIRGYLLDEDNYDLKKICDEVMYAVKKEKMRRKFSAPFKVGLDELVKDFHSRCQRNGLQRNGQMRDNIIGIYGIGGSGKTTLAEYLFDHKRSEFSRSAILYDVRGEYAKGELASMQTQLLNDLFPGNQYSSSSIEDALQDNPESKFLLVLDNVDDQKQLDDLLPRDSLNPNSLVILTTRDESFLEKASIGFRYVMKQMSPEHSKQLFCLHAFSQHTCKDGFENLVDEFVKECKYLPLALKVMGAHVSGRDKGNWEIQLADVRGGKLQTDIKHTLKISYDALDDYQKQLFMDIACFFIGEDVSMAINIWRSSEWSADNVLQTLVGKCLVEVKVQLVGLYEHRRIFRMHDLLRDLGLDLADNVNPRRLWRSTELLAVYNIGGLKNILENSPLIPISFRCFSRISESNFVIKTFLETSKTSVDLKWLYFKHTGSSKPPEGIPEWLCLQNLQTLIVEQVFPKLWQRDDQAPLKLKELRYCFTRWDVIERHNLLEYLKELLSSLTSLKHLEVLHLEFGPRCMCNIDWNCFIASIRELISLKTLELFHFNIQGEIALRNMGRTSLEAITLYCLFNTRKLSIGGQLCETLKSLKLYFMEDIIEVDLTEATKLESLELLGCPKLRKVLVNDLLNLEMFRIRLCWTMEELPNFGRDSCLKRIYISRCRNLQNISAIESLKGLKRIWIVDCPKLHNIKAIEQLQGLTRIWIAKCPELKDTICVKELKELKRIFIADCPKLQNIEGIESLIYLERIMVASCPKIQNIRGFEKLQWLKKIIISDSPIVNCVKYLQTLPRKLTIVMGRPAVSDLNAGQIGHALSMVDGFCEIGCEQQVEDSIDSLHKTQHSLSTFIFCAMLEGCPDICMATYYKGYKGNADLCRHRGKWIYMCVFNEEMRSEYECWKPSSCDTRKAFLMAVEKGEEGKAIAILQSLFAELCDGEYYENAGDDDHHGVNDDQEEAEDAEYDEYHKYEDSHNYDDYVDYDGYADYDDEDEEYDGSDD